MFKRSRRTFSAEFKAQVGQEGGMLGQMLAKAQGERWAPAKLGRLMKMVDDVTGITLAADPKGDFDEGIFDKNPEDARSGSGS